MDREQLEPAIEDARAYLASLGLDASAVDRARPIVESDTSFAKRSSLALFVRAVALRIALAGERSASETIPSTLAAADRLIIALHTDEKLSIDDIARFYQIPRDSAQRRLDEALAAQSTR